MTSQRDVSSGYVEQPIYDHVWWQWRCVLDNASWGNGIEEIDVHNDGARFGISRTARIAT